MKILKVRKDEVKNEFFYDVKICGKKFENVKTKEENIFGSLSKASQFIEHNNGYLSGKIINNKLT